MTYRLNDEERRLLFAACYGDPSGRMTRPPLLKDENIQTGWKQKPKLWDEKKKKYISEHGVSMLYIREHCTWTYGKPKLVKRECMIEKPHITAEDILFIFDNMRTQ